MLLNYTYNNYQLDEDQLKILEFNEDMLVIAGAGSGKTFTMQAKVDYLIKNKLATPDEILFISFTNATVNDIKEKLLYKIDVMTFHKFALTILEKSSTNFKLNNNLLPIVIEEYLSTASLQEQKIILKYAKSNYKYCDFIQSIEYNSFYNFICKFINLYKTNDFSKNNITHCNFTKTEKKILTIIFKIYNQYLLEKRSTSTFDFDDLLIFAKKKVQEIKINYKYIIVDEFQDTSLIRFNLLYEIKNTYNPKIIAVGDDWQSIYRFSGCDVDIFLNIDNYISNIKKLRLNMTYRNSTNLINIAKMFIEKNKYQIVKNLKSNNNIIDPVVLCPYINEKDILKGLLDSLNTSDIMIISRNHNDIYNYMDNTMTFENDILLYKNLNIPYYTIHKSKGLEAKYVIVLNCNNDKLGFPNKIEENKIISKLFLDDKYPYAEERRLFYVAITRCKSKVFLVYNKNTPSLFIKEIKKITKLVTNNICYFK